MTDLPSNNDLTSRGGGDSKGNIVNRLFYYRWTQTKHAAESKILVGYFSLGVVQQFRLMLTTLVCVNHCIEIG